LALRGTRVRDGLGSPSTGEEMGAEQAMMAIRMAAKAVLGRCCGESGTGCGELKHCRMHTEVCYATLRRKFGKLIIAPESIFVSKNAMVDQ